MDLFKDLMCCGQKDGRTEGQRQNSIPPKTQFAGGIIIELNDLRIIT